MKTKILITRQTMGQRDGVPLEYIVTSVFAEQTMIEVNCEPTVQTSILGNIYIGKVKNIVKNLNAAFIEIGQGMKCYYSLEDLHHPVFTKKSGKKELAQGDELVVQIAKEAIKTKDPVVTTNLTFTGKYVVLSTENTRIGISNKMNEQERAHYKQLLAQYRSDEYGFIVRTNAKNTTDAEVLRELEQLVKEFKKLKETACHRTCFSVLKEAEPQYIQNIRNSYMDQLDEIVTDDAEIYENIAQYMEKERPDFREKLRFYEDAMLSLSSLYNISGILEDAGKERVWLKSGAYLIIQPTEALTVIDVNSGKNIARKNPQENFLKINLEAAKEIAHQLRLRNLSGICVVDFIDLTSKDAQQQLLEEFQNYVKTDPVPTRVIDLTRLGLVELTRKKVRKSLAEQIK